MSSSGYKKKVTINGLFTPYDLDSYKPFKFTKDIVIVNKPNIDIPTVANKLYYDGNEKYPVFDGFNEEIMTISGYTSGVDAGEYIVTFTPKDGYEWSDGDTTSKNVIWNIIAPTPFTITQDNRSEIGYTDESINLIIPQYFIGTDGIYYEVTCIGERAFNGCINLSTIFIPESVYSIDRAAFSGCTKLTSVNIPNAVSVISNSAFSGCSILENIIIPDGVTSISSYAFSTCNNLISITIPNSVVNIGNSAFRGCSILGFVYYNGTREEWDSITIGDTNEYLLNAEKIFI